MSDVMDEQLVKKEPSVGDKSKQWPWILLLVSILGFVIFGVFVALNIPYISCKLFKRRCPSPPGPDESTCLDNDKACNSREYCAIYNQEVLGGTNIDQKIGCFAKSDYTVCPASTDGRTYVCPTHDTSVHCQLNAAHVKGDKKQYYCARDKCDAEKYAPCIDSSDCFGSDCDKRNPDAPFNAKKFKQMGVCRGHSQSTYGACLTKEDLNSLGENLTKTGLQIIEKCDNPETGISTSVDQCANSTDASKPACCLYGTCRNQPWKCLPDESFKGHDCDDDSKCCKFGTSVPNSDYCCPAPLVDKQCMNVSKYKVDPAFIDNAPLPGSPKKDADCNTSAVRTALQRRFPKGTAVVQREGTVMPSNYVGLVVGEQSGKKVCKLIAGDRDAVGGKPNPFVILNNEQTKTSTAMKPNSCRTTTIRHSPNTAGDSELVQCTKGPYKANNEYDDNVWGIYKDEPSAGNYHTYLDYDVLGEGCDHENACYYAYSPTGVASIDEGIIKQMDKNTYNVASKYSISKTGQQCVATLDCKDVQQKVTTTGGDSALIKWSPEPDSLPVNMTDKIARPFTEDCYSVHLKAEDCKDASCKSLASYNKQRCEDLGDPPHFDGFERAPPGAMKGVCVTPQRPGLSTCYPATSTGEVQPTLIIDSTGAGKYCPNGTDDGVSCHASTLDRAFDAADPKGAC